MISLAIYSDIRLYRRGLSCILSERNEIDVAALIECNDQLRHLLKNQRLNLLLIDVRGVCDTKELSTILKADNNLQVIAMSLEENDDCYQWCIQSGVTGYLAKEATIDELLRAIKSVTNNQFYCQSSITNHLMKRLNGGAAKREKTPARNEKVNSIAQLTRREKQILELLVKGLSNKKIASNLNIQLSTVKNHVHNILLKMGVQSRSQLASLVYSKKENSKNESLDLVPHVNFT
jgi:two-component system, NarL family, nitrate/nitrite response regulator NarL